MTDATQALLPVTQSDRDAAAPFANCLSDMQDIFDGRADGLPVVQAFARHRQAHSLPGDVGMLRAALTTARGYVEGNHDEGCELDPEFGEQNFDDEDDTRIWPEDRECTCGTDEILASIDAALTPSALSGDAGEGERSAIVAWLRSKDEGTLVGWRPEFLADLIERGEHYSARSPVEGGAR